MSAAAIAITGVAVERRPGATTLQGEADGQRLFWQMPERPEIAARGEPFIAALLVSAMATRRDLVLPGAAPVDAFFLESIRDLQNYLARWTPELGVVAVHAETVAPRRTTSGRLADYAGGIDTGYTLLRRAPLLDGVVMVDDGRIRTPNPELAALIESALATVVAGRGLPLVPVTTNAPTVADALADGRPLRAGARASVGHALGAAEYWVASTASWPSAGFAPADAVSDPLFSSSTTQIRSHGAEARRIDKLRVLSTARDLFDAVRVCHQGTTYNCGTCHQCLRARAALRALELRAESLPPLDEPRLLRRIVIRGDADLEQWQDILAATVRTRDPALAHELRRPIVAYLQRARLRQLDRILTGGLVTWAIRRLHAASKRTPGDHDALQPRGAQ